ncbi:MAG: hypothetical protein IPQ18_14710 [Saprospiraceae bacterium]|nr:hypothetical protein [Saprospiraceae bacterium]
MVILLIMGILDDRLDLRASLKFAIQILLAHFIYSQGVKIESLNGYLEFIHSLLGSSTF